jgi:hypothetical protein
MAGHMANRYLHLMPVIERLRLFPFARLLSAQPETLPPGKLSALAREVDNSQNRLDIPSNVRTDLEDSAKQYLSRTKSSDNGDDIRLAMVKILMERYVKRTPQRDLFGKPEDIDDNSSNLSQVLSVGSSLADGARIYLLHHHDRPYYYGLECLCRASNKNAQQFLRLARPLVDLVETRAIRRRGNHPIDLTARDQDRLLREEALELIRDWNFPEVERVRYLVDGIARWCLDRSLEANASLGGGATAVGVPQIEFNRVVQDRGRLAQVLHFAVAYNALQIEQRRQVKHREWTVIELGGLVRVTHGLTLLDGGFVERHTSDLERLITGESE